MKIGLHHWVKTGELEHECRNCRLRRTRRARHNSTFWQYTYTRPGGDVVTVGWLPKCETKPRKIEC